MKNRKRILAAILTAIMTISILPANSFASEAGENDTAEAAVEAVSVSDEEQEVESTVEDISEETASETEEESSVIDETEEVSEPETTEEAEAVVEEEDLAAEEAEETVEADEVVETVEDDIETVDTESEGPKTLKAEGKDYIVTVTYNDSALLPDDVKIEVEEIKENAKKYDSYCDEALEAVQKENEEAEEISYIRLFDITLVDGEGKKVQPETAVDVQIRLKDVKSVEDNTQIVHFAGKEEKPEVIETDIEKNTVAFEAEGFSIYAVVTSGEYARLTVNFKKSDADTTTMYVKKKDITDGKLNQVLYDPGVPVQEGKKFLGWTDNQNWTELTVDDMKAAAKTIDTVRSEVTTTLNNGITDGQSVTYYAMMVNCFELYYQDEYGNTFRTENVLSAGSSGTTIVNQAYTLTGGSTTENFIGWKVKEEPAPENPTVYPNGSEITISGNTTLVPAIGVGRWLWFDSNAGGAGVSEASYTAPQFVAAGGKATEPAAPTRPGYTFDGWFDAAEGGNAFDFDIPLDQYTTDSEGRVMAYAHWTAKTDASYKVVIWAQKVTDSKDAADKKYDYVRTYEVSNAVAGTILDETELRKSSDDYFDKDNAFFGADELEHDSKAFEYSRFEVVRGIGPEGNGVNPDGSTVVNVYYDRALFTIIFVGNGSQPYDYYYPVENGEDVYGLVDGEYVKVTTVISNKRVEFTKEAGPGSMPATITNVKTEITRVSDLWAAETVAASSLYSTSGKLLTNESVGSTGTKVRTRAGGTDYLFFTTNSTNNNNYCQLRWTVKGDYSYTYNGAPYTGQLYAKTTQNGEAYTGLYGQTMKQNGYTWPEPQGTQDCWHGLSWLEAFRGNLFGSATLGFGTGVGGIPNTIIARPETNPATSTIIFWFEDVDNEGQYKEAGRQNFYFKENSRYNITERILGGEFDGYQWTTSQSMPLNWSYNVGEDGFTNDERGSNTYMHIRYKRAKYSIRFMQGSTELKSIDNVKYEQSIQNFESQAPTNIQVGEDEFFDGWFEDPEGITRVNWNTRMPAGDKLIYAVVRHSQYHVFVDMDGGTLPSGQRNQFWENWGNTINGTAFKNATKSDAEGNTYTLVGYYWDEDLTRPWDFNVPLSQEYLWHIYEDTAEGEDPFRTSDFFGPGNDDSNYPQCVGIFRLWAKWRNDSLTGGLHIRYKNPSGAADYSYEDELKYVDTADVITAQAPPENKWPEGKRFDGWQLKEGKVYKPGDIFMADSDDAVVENEEHWITLTAVYVDKENRTPTHVTWYKNYGTGGYYHTDNDYSINAAITIYGTGEGQQIPTRDGYRFLGWAKDTEKESADAQAKTTTDKTTADFLEYKDGNFYLPDSTTKVTAVAADEVLPYEALYAIWEPTQYHIYHSSTRTITNHDMPADGTDNIAEKVANGWLYGGYYKYIENAEDPKGDQITNIPGTRMVPEKGETYYLREVDPNYLKPSVYLLKNTLHNGLITDLYGFVNFDSINEYNEYGIIVNGTEESVKKTLVTEGYEITRGGQPYATLNGKNLFGMEGAAIGYKNLKSYIVGGDTVQIGGYYVTKDNVKVTGRKDRMIKFAANDERYKAPIFTGWSTEGGNTRIGLKTMNRPPVEVAAKSAKPMLAKRMMTISAAPEKMEYTITKVYDNGTNEEVVEEGDYTGLISYEARSGYLFAGWYKDAAFTEPADFSAVSSDMTVYAKYVKASDVSVAFTSKSLKSGTATLNATVSVKGQADLEKVTVSTKGTSSSVLATKTVKKTGSGKNIKYTTQYKGTAAVKGVSMISSFTASVSWTTPDGTVVSGPSYNCSYVLGIVTVR